MHRVQKSSRSMSTTKILGFIAAAAALVLVVENYADIRRYIKIELM
jgi:hypothetical protein